MWESNYLGNRILSKVMLSKSLDQEPFISIKKAISPTEKTIKCLKMMYRKNLSPQNNLMLASNDGHLIQGNRFLLSSPLWKKLNCFLFPCNCLTPMSLTLPQVFKYIRVMQHPETEIYIQIPSEDD